MTGRGRVTLVGAGPGDPDLLTVRAVRALEHADVVFYDALVDARTVAIAARAAKFAVGKRAGAASVAQETIHGVMIRSARANKRVVRLKAGDPFVLGRGGEEVLALGAAGVDVDVVPGISSALAGPGAAGIPVTHRSVASAFVVASAVPEDRFARLCGGLPAAEATIVVLMGVGARGFVAKTLRDAGWDGTTPSALVLGAHGPRQWSWTGTLTSLGDLPIPEAHADLPGVIVVGEVARVGERMAEVLGRTREQELRREHG